MRYAVLGGTGTLGSALIRELVKNPVNEVVCFSRCELKQKALRKELAGPHNLKFVIGDIRDRWAVSWVLKGIDTVFLTAALKHIDVAEENPEESVKTNILGAMIVADEAIEAGCEHVVFSSTDKAVEPINVYGMCKAVSERIFLSRNERQQRTKFSVFRWGNVVGSRGSIIPTFVRTLTDERRAYVTDFQMTRFWLEISEAVKFILSEFERPGLHIMIPKSAPVTKIIDRLASLMGIENYEIIPIGSRPGEKLHEKLTANLCSDTCTFSDQELDRILKPLVEASR